MPLFKAPSLPPGRDKHHVVVLETAHSPAPTFDFLHHLTLHSRTQPHEVADRVKEATIVVVCIQPILPAHLDVAKDLKCLAIMAVGISWLDKAGFAKRGVTAINCAGGNVDAVGEHVLALYFGIRKRISEVDYALKHGSEWVDKGTLSGRWNGKPPIGCKQEVLGVLGYGNLGKNVARLARAVGFGEILISEHKGKKGNQVREGRTDFEYVVRRATTIVVCLPKQDDTVDLIGEKELRLMKPDAIIINVARGGIVNEAALATALKEGLIYGAATDVLETEPGGPGTSPLLPELTKGEELVPNLLVTPHLAWFSQTTIQNYQAMAKEGVERWVEGKLLQGDQIDPLVVVHDGKVWR